jgi:hypothetical protein
MGERRRLYERCRRRRRPSAGALLRAASPPWIAPRVKTGWARVGAYASAVTSGQAKAGDALIHQLLLLSPTELDSGC